jgi:hypothetical protein
MVSRTQWMLQAVGEDDAGGLHVVTRNGCLSNSASTVMSVTAQIDWTQLPTRNRSKSHGVFPVSFRSSGN